MQRKIALQRLSASDLTFFEYHYRNTEGTKQKAFNLDRAVFIDVLYPSLPVAVGDGSVRVSMSIRGPGMAPAQNLMRKILKQEKNWRLNGELIFDPPDTAGVYSTLQKGDFAIIEFIGGITPDTLSVQLVAQAQPDDQKLHTALSAQYGSSFTSHKGMIAPDPDEFLETLAAAGMKPAHPANDLLEADYLEDVVQGGILGFDALAKRRKGRSLSKAEFQQSKDNADRVGREGEELVNWHLSELKKKAQIEDFEWTSDSNPIAPYDFAILESGAIKRKIDVKSTSGKLSNPVHVSMAELREMIHSTVPYEIFRVHEVKNGSGMLSVSMDLGDFAKSVGNSLSVMPNGVTPDSFSIDTRILNLGPATRVTIPDEEEQDS